MAKILIIDDDAGQELLAESLRFRGHEVNRFSSASQAIDGLKEVLDNDIILLDILMDIPQDNKAQFGKFVGGIRSVGMHIYRLIRSKNEEIPIIVYSGANDVDNIQIINGDPYSRFLPKWRMPSPQDIDTIIADMLGISPVTPKHEVFIVHGHNNTLMLELKNYLQNTLGFKEPTILHEKPDLGRTIIEKFEDYAFRSNLVFVILSPDDIIVNYDKSDDEKRIARQNVIFELGFFLGLLGRESGRVILLYVNPLELPSDLSGVIYIDVSDGVEAAGENIRRELDNVNKRTSSW